MKNFSTRRATAVAAIAVTSLAAHAQPVAQASIASNPTKLAPIEIVGRTSAGPYHAGETDGTKTDVPLRELPQAVRVITRQAMDDLGATRLDDILDYVGGVSRQNVFGGLWDNIAIRGLPGNENTGMATLFNGFSANRGFNAPRDLASIDRVEFLKGPAAALYGTSEPGGTLNMVSKRPRFQSAHALEAYVGSFDSARIALDSTGPLGQSVAYRLNAVVENRGSVRDFVDSKRNVIAPALTWQLSQSTQINYAGEVLEHRTPLDRGVVAINNQLDVVPRERFLSEPADGRVAVANSTHQLSVQHEWSPTWSSRAASSVRRTSIYGFSTEPTALRADNTLTRQRRFRDYSSNDTAWQMEATGKWSKGLPQDLLLGLEGYRYEIDTVMLRINPSATTPYAINVFSPVYGQAQPVPSPNTSTLEQQRGRSIYAQYTAKFYNLRILTGVRNDQNEQTLANRRTIRTTTVNTDATTARMGVSYLLDTFTVYANAGQSFRPNAGTDALSRGFNPERGSSTELGLKWESANRLLGATLAWFDIEKRNVLTSDPGNAGFSIAAGKVRSKGLEFDLSGQIAPKWRVNANALFNDVAITQDNSLELGGRFLNVPRNTASLLVVHQLGMLGKSASLGGGITHVGARLGEAGTQAQANANAVAFDLPAYTTAKLVAQLQWSPSLRFTLDVDNLLDKSHYTSSFSRVWVTPGPARSLTLGVQAKF